MSYYPIGEVFGEGMFVVTCDDQANYYKMPEDPEDFIHDYLTFTENIRRECISTGGEYLYESIWINNMIDFSIKKLNLDGTNRDDMLELKRLRDWIRFHMIYSDTLDCYYYNGHKLEYMIEAYTNLKYGIDFILSRLQ